MSEAKDLRESNVADSTSFSDSEKAAISRFASGLKQHLYEKVVKAVPKGSTLRIGCAISRAVDDHLKAHGIPEGLDKRP